MYVCIYVKQTIATCIAYLHCSNLLHHLSVQKTKKAKIALPAIFSPTRTQLDLDMMVFNIIVRVICDL